MGHLDDGSRAPVALRGQEVAVGGGGAVTELIGEPLGAHHGHARQLRVDERVHRTRFAAEAAPVPMHDRAARARLALLHTRIGSCLLAACRPASRHRDSRMYCSRGRSSTYICQGAISFVTHTHI